MPAAKCMMGHSGILQLLGISMYWFVSKVPNAFIFKAFLEDSACVLTLNPPVGRVCTLRKNHLRNHIHLDPLTSS